MSHSLGFLPHRCEECGGTIHGDGEFARHLPTGTILTVHDDCRAAAEDTWGEVVHPVNVTVKG